MADSSQTSVEAVESYRLQLEQNMNKLRKALQHWQTWEAEYEAFGEELTALPADADEDALIEAGKNVEGDLLVPKEINELLGVGKGIRRTAKEVSNLLTRRIDYVQRNIQTLQKQVDEAELTLADTHVDQKHVKGLTVADIQEELDEDGNVISSKLVNPDEAAPVLLKTLRKAGISQHDLHEDSEDEQDNGRSVPASASNIESVVTNTSSKSGSSPLLDNKHKTSKKSVTFTDGTEKSSTIPKLTKPATSEPQNSSSILSEAAVQQDNSAKEFLASNLLPDHERVIEVDENDNVVRVTGGAVFPANPQDETEEDAALRREMLRYSMGEVGAIVAQLDLDEEEDWEDEDENDSAFGSSDDDDDEHGLRRSSGINDDYRREMLELEKKLGGRFVQNLGPQALANELESNNSAGPSDPGSTNGAKSNTSSLKQKGVRFAEVLDIAEASGPSTGSNAAATTRSSQPVNDRIVEKLIQPTEQASTAGKPAKRSRFKSARSEDPTATSIPKPTTTDTPSRAPQPLASRIVERPPELIARPPSPDELDPDLIRRQVETEYQTRRAEMRQKQDAPRTEEDDYKPEQHAIDNNWYYTEVIDRDETERMNAARRDPSNYTDYDDYLDAMYEIPPEPETTAEIKEREEMEAERARGKTEKDKAAAVVNAQARIQPEIGVEEEEESEDEKQQPKKKVSMFKAARLKQGRDMNRV